MLPVFNCNIKRVLMQEVIESILENSKFEKEEKFKELLQKSLKVADESTKSTYAIYDNIIFKIETFFKNFEAFQNEFGKDKKYLAGVHALRIITDELGFEFEDQELFVLYHLKDLGKFKIREQKLEQELVKPWNNHKEFKLEGSDLTYALKDLMRAKFIEYRRGLISTNSNVLVRFRTKGPNRKR